MTIILGKSIASGKQMLEEKEESLDGCPPRQAVRHLEGLMERETDSIPKKQNLECISLR